MGAQGAAVLSALGTARVALAQCLTQPAQTQGPYWVDEMLNRADIRSDPGTGVVQPGMPLRMAVNVSETTGGACAPLSGAYVDLWHCSATGIYSDTAAQGTVGQKFLRGYQVTDSHGNVRFLTIYPGWYMGRTVHIHFRVRKFSGATTTFNFVSQFYFNDATTTAIFQSAAPYNTRPNRDTFNANDMVYANGGAQLLMRMSYNTNHVIASFNVVVNSVPGLMALGVTPPDPEAEEHASDPGGGTPPPPLELV